MENKGINIEMSDMIGKTYFKIATWFNQDFNNEKERQENLKHISAEIIQQILEDTFLQIEGINKTEVLEIKKQDVISKIETNPNKMFNGYNDPIINKK